MPWMISCIKHHIQKGTIQDVQKCVEDGNHEFTKAAPDLPHPEDILTIIPRLFGSINGIKWRNTFAIPFTLVSITVSNSSTGTSQILLFLLIVPALFTANTL